MSRSAFEEEVRARLQARQEAEQRQAEVHRADQANRSKADETEGPYDRLNDALMDTVSDALFSAIHSPDFAAALRNRGYALSPICTDDPPEPPSEWLHDGLNLTGADGVWNQPLETLGEMWSRAWLAGWQANAARSDQQ